MTAAKGMQRKKQMNVMRAYRLVDVRFFSFGIAEVTFFESVPRSAKQMFDVMAPATAV